MTTLYNAFNELQDKLGPGRSHRERSADNIGDAPTEVIEALQRMDLLASGDRAQVTRLAGSLSADIYRIELGWGTVCVKRALPKLKRADIPAPVGRNRFESQWLRLARAVIAESVPEVLGENAGMFAMEYFEPRRYASWLAQLRDGDISPSTAAEVGRLIGRVHAATSNNLAVGQQFDTDQLFQSLRIEPIFIATARAQPGVGARLKQLAMSLERTKLALVHGTLAPENVLIGPRGPVLIDAECAWYGDPAFDLANCLAHLLMMCVARPQWRDRYLTCFDALCATYAQRVTWEMPEQTDERAAQLVPAILLGGAHGQLPAEFLCDPRERDSVAGIARQLLVEPLMRLAAIRETWRRALSA